MAAVTHEIVDGIGQLVLRRPDQSNSFDLPAARDMAQAVDSLSVDEVRAIALTAEGKRFCAGGDVTSFLASDDPAAYLLDLANVLEGALRALAGLATPVVAGVRGAVAGAGLAVMLSADVIVASRSTKFVMAYPGIGLTPDCGVSYLLPRAIGQQRALDLALTGRVLSADEALDWGLVTSVVDDEDVEATVATIARTWADTAPAALGQARRLLRSSWENSGVDQGADESATIAAAVTGDEAQRLVKAFTSR
ncbi:enoyl-CoA hydratase/isomerase family protein [Aeromicrobium fastidiosum]|uniref:Enoyl-CoA hydratase/isomerase family protein n=1 Tax=Aeromicrobium fastidiosum TaxID=52699 RepID=A0A641AS43_9ACTN|nr:enoyl-CoA hydratase/isomerase family protein [Aeromicrobium fastidiosum]KAA1380043.1 enoyl-CoA hydratase/isomerase family protein [Aeromicrobium fastidiosum]MBP2389569.1 2-(1,2-epoxy-1,2-dihydrophenyl)acetyl-CoA isomerase [Aeromicrobium fastidiosum]